VDRKTSQEASAWDSALSNGKSGAIRSAALSNLAKLNEPIAHINLGGTGHKLNCEYQSNNYVNLSSHGFTVIDKIVDQVPFEVQNSNFFVDLRLDGIIVELVNFDELYLQAPIFTNSNQTNNSFQSAVLVEPQFQGATLDSVCFAGALIAVGHFNTATIVRGEFYYTTIVQSDFSHAVINSSRVHVKEIEDTDFSHDCIIASQFSGLLRTKFDNSFIDHSQFRVNSEDIVKEPPSVTFRGAYISNSSFSGQVFEDKTWALGADPPPDRVMAAGSGILNFANAKIVDSSFAGPTLSDTTFAGARLKNVDFTRVMFNNVDISGTNFDSKFSVEACDRKIENITNYAISGDKFTDALTNEQLRGAWAWDDRLPVGLPAGVRPSHVCKSVLRSQYETSESLGIPAGC
jgi:uncharacterized protein YjbI with pentapeptide repeats